MKFTQQRRRRQLIRRYGADFIVVAEQEIRASCIVVATHTLRLGTAQRRRAHPEHLGASSNSRPRSVVLSTGATQKSPTRGRCAREFATPANRARGDGRSARARAPYNVLSERKSGRGCWPASVGCRDRRSGPSKAQGEKVLSEANGSKLTDSN
jgi:hypothetical protein